METKHTKQLEDVCKTETDSTLWVKAKLPELINSVIDNCQDDQDCFVHIDYEPIPSKEHVIAIIENLMEVLFPGYYNRERIDPLNLKYYLGKTVSRLFTLLSEQISCSIRHDCRKYNIPCSDCVSRGHFIAISVIESVPSIRKTLALDVKAAYEGDPAAKSYDEIIFSYPGLFAIAVYRVAHLLYKHDVPLLPRIMTEHAHSITGIDIHPGAQIGEAFVIDHGTGVVIGETTVIGKNVRLYQSVTLGALSLPKNAGARLKGKKRHPTIEDDVIIYSGATILGGKTVIGNHSVIGGNVWITESVPPNTKVLLEKPLLKFLK